MVSALAGAAAAALLFPGPARLQAQAADSTLLTTERIFASAEFRSQPFGPARWLEDGSAYTTLEPSADGPGRDIVRYDAASGRREVLVPAGRLRAPGDTLPLDIEDYGWSKDLRRLLVFSNSKPVWRLNTRGDYWVLDRSSGRLTKLGGRTAKPSTLMFAKFSPDGRRVGYVRENNIYVEDLAGGRIVSLTRDGSRTMINGTFDWVYEEELMNGNADGWRWSPDGASIAYWQLNADSVRNFNLVNNTDSLYSQVTPVQYPKVGEANSAARVGVVSAGGGATRWMRIAGDPRAHYIGRMEWAANSREITMQRLNRLQNTDELLLGDAHTGAVRPILVERDRAWVDLVDDMAWLGKGAHFLWISDRTGWTHAYVVSRDGQTVQPVTHGDFDVIKVVGLDEKAGWLYYIASPDNPRQRYLYRTRLDGSGSPERLTPAREPGTHGYDVAPDMGYAIETWSKLGTPKQMRLVRLADHGVVRPLAENRAVRAKVAGLNRGPVEFFGVQGANGVRMPGVLMKPPGFDSTRKYPLLFFVYGGPASTTTNDAWDSGYLYHLMLTQRGFLVASVDNRGTPAPLGRAWRKAVYGQLGVLETDDQAAAARALARRPYVDRARIGIWGWSNGGFMSLNMLFRHPELYRTAVVVSPVTHWSLYDNVYTERYNGLITTNKDGYDRGSPLTYVDGMRGDLLLIHGSGDDNVHFQNSERLINALVEAGKPFQMMEYPNRTHCICQGTGTPYHLY
ncbi:MAG: S9 family peptidase, partial [Gemmatimonadales bacterium]|nr:S9 family peptidase [Gemmatimonadales bacterium]